VKLSKTLVVPVAFLLVAVGAGAVLASTTSSPAANGAPIAPGADAPSAAPAASPAASPKVGPLKAAQDQTLTTVLDGLVADGTITAAQEKAIQDGLTAERAKQQADRKAKMDVLKAQAAQLKSFLADGVITQDELNQLPADSPIRKLTNLMADGKITTDELKSIGKGFGFGRGFGPFGGFGPGRGFGHQKNNASPAPSPATGG
jgi:polyhydroxyalkanoate synthesis regulator phasin